MEQLGRNCFFCSKEIVGRKTLEHIIPNGLLGKLGIKEETITGERKSQYSRTKVPAHASCNNGFGSKYENRVIELLDDTDRLYETLKCEEDGFSLIYGAAHNTSSIITTWLSKIYYGLFYDDYIKTKDKSWRNTCSSLINSSNMGLVRKSYQNGYGFQLPSSLFVFKTKNEEFDLTTMVEPSAILLKVKSITFILCMCDGYLTKNYLNGKTLAHLRNVVAQEDNHNIDFPSHRLAFAEILALRSCIPKSPSFIFSDNQVVNMSLSTLAEDPNGAYQIDGERLNYARIAFGESLHII
ncbi:hypothetical protein [Photobacterium swingsii]|uniref:hypothetical protein n=1 Tax=Photobacterium swingsii TaxID=680026 RepID=UPI004067CE03